ncbi:MAG: HAD-IA family hydrolase [Treponemataceae bacterium]|nr:HAD-IA family hydrolase [Treponemataceae bacterium]
MSYLFVFDIGGVVLESANILPQICERLNVSREVLDKQSSLMEAMERGLISSEEFWMIYCERVQCTTVSQNYWKTLFNPVVRKDTAQLVSRIRNAGFRVVAGTNTIDVHYQAHIEHGDYELFDAVYASNLIHCVKPRPSFFYHILENDSGAESFDKMIFVDDSPENVAAAVKLGMHGILFTDAESVQREIEKIIGTNL